MEFFQAVMSQFPGFSDTLLGHVVGDDISKAGPVAAYEYLSTADRNEPFPDPLFFTIGSSFKNQRLTTLDKKGVKRRQAHIFL
ncbi:hypothetical protein [Pseudomonas cichorii]|uniref:hypothetical protein n=1 Tax=Pseudomonas cichorii TaxID=36746 RepID=UPI001C8A00A6|nr:hypothetical protein [Pseudomonas cichorii]MBX8497484.1 hypothetical protein [Pseudomonas cichorii]